MKVVFILPNMGAGGAERVVTILSKTLAEKGVAVDIVMLFSEDVRYWIPDNVCLISLNTGGRSLPERVKILRGYLIRQKREHGKVIAIPFQHNCLKYALLSAFGLGIQVIACERNDPYQKGTCWKDKLAANIPYLLADHCVFQTPDARDYYFSAVRKKSMVIENPLVLPEKLRWQGQNSKRIVSVGRLDAQKNQKILIEAFCVFHQKHPNYILEIYGEGSLREQLQAQINSLGLQKVVFLKGYSSEIHENLSQAKLFVLPSDYEGMSNALIEALAIGVPVVTTDHPIGGARMLIEHKVNGLLTPVGNSLALYEAMDYLICQPEVSEALGENGIMIRERLNAERITHQWMSLFE